MTNCAHHSHCISTALTDAEAYCAQHNLRFTDIRRKVFALIWESHKALTAPEIMTLLGNDQPPITYRALQFLQENSLIHHIASINAYVGCQHVGQHNHHSHTGQLLICTNCRQVTELEQPLPQLSTAAEAQGFHIASLQVEALGLCRTCATA